MRDEESDIPEKLRDYRAVGNYKTRYPPEVCRKINIEALYLVSLIVVFGFIVGFLASRFYESVALVEGSFWSAAIGHDNDPIYQNLFVGLTGIVGGALFALKWLIHAVAKGIWNEDRQLWRYTVPFTAGVVALAFGAIVQSGIISLFRPEPFSNLYLASAFGFLVGYFSDGVIGVLSNIAAALFGTVHDRAER